VKPIIKVNHRFGNVFLRIVRMGKKGRTSTPIKMTPHEARIVAGELHNATLDAERCAEKLRIK
jgi:hypothetical protein